MLKNLLIYHRIVSLVSDGANLAVGAGQELAVVHRLAEPDVVKVEHVVDPVPLSYFFPAKYARLENLGLCPTYSDDWLHFGP